MLCIFESKVSFLVMQEISGISGFRVARRIARNSRGVKIFIQSNINWKSIILRRQNQEDTPTHSSQNYHKIFQVHSSPRNTKPRQNINQRPTSSTINNPITKRQNISLFILESLFGKNWSAIKVPRLNNRNLVGVFLRGK